ncbi:MAG: PAS domain-containing sensor histidine kinase [Desulfobulbaceae bacterium]|nr:PAS domain-containing sensor histidine kinase [Candidatus Kapabacteria bacterium]MBS4000307.1 PAS domain-containing sensor histidine kinase [Desulfobulbaceae bacterium]
MINVQNDIKTLIGTIERLKSENRYLKKIIADEIGGKLTEKNSDIKNMLEQKLESDYFFRSIFDHTPAGIIILNIEKMTILEVNHAFCQLLGYSEAEFLKLHLSDLSEKEVYEAEIELIIELTKNEISTHRFVKPYLHKNGETVWCDLTITRLQFKEFNMEFVIGIAVDISQQISSEKERELTLAKLADREEQYKLLVENIPDATWILDRDGNTHYVSPNIYNITGFSPEEIIANSKEIWFNRIHHDDRERINKEFDELFEFNKPYIVEYRWLHPNGNYIWISERSVKHTLFNGTRVAIGSYSDICSRKALEQQQEETQQLLKELNADKDTFFNIIAHDLRSPLTGIMMMLKDLADNFDTIPTNQIKEYTINLKEASSALFNLLENLLQWSMSQTKKLVPRPRYFQISEVVESSFRLNMENAQRKQIDLNHICECDFILYADIEMIKTILRNLLSNAIKFTPTNGKVTLNCVCHEDHVLVSVNDTGIGMDNYTLENLFKITNSEARLGTEGEKGTGLGLLLSKEFAHMNGGDIIVESTPDIGSTFTLVLPVVENKYN